MAEVKLITINDFAQYKQILSTVNTAERLDPYIFEAQRLDIKSFLGEEFYYDFIENKSTAANTKLLTGGDYIHKTKSYYFNGLKPALVYFSYARFLLNQNVTVTQFGVVHKRTEFSEQADNETIARLVTQAKEVAFAYLREAELFLDRNIDDYPLWKYCGIRNSPSHGARITKVTPP